MFIISFDPKLSFKKNRVSIILPTLQIKKTKGQGG
jgi:hypothetical protein